jgi:AcrR family transcriptional regulator
MVAEPAKAKSSRQSQRVNATRQKLLDAARSVFAEKGMDLTRIDEITERADVGKGTFYYHFGSKDQLIRAVIRRMLGELVETIDERCSGIGELRGLLDALIGAHISFFSNRWEDFVLYFQGRSDLTLEQGYAGIETPFVNYLERVEELLASVIKHRLPPTVLRRVACAVAGFVSGYYSFVAIAPEGEDVDATFRSLRGAIVASLARFVQEAGPSPEAGTSASSTA